LQNHSNRFPLFGGQIGELVLRNRKHFGRVKNEVKHVRKNKLVRSGIYVVSMLVNGQNYVAVFVNNYAVVEVGGGDLQNGIFVKNRVVDNACARHCSR